MSKADKKRPRGSSSSGEGDDDLKILEKLVSIRERIENGFTRINEEIEVLKSELKDDIKAIRGELSEAMKSLNAAWEEVMSHKQRT